MQIIIVLFILYVTPAFAAEYIESLGDIPLMPELTIRNEHTVIFDVPEGRVVEVTATSATSIPVAAFYAQSLPALGWKAHGNSGYYRERERLDIITEQDGRGIRVIFSLKPE
jgi:hypothetical protein